MLRSRKGKRQLKFLSISQNSSKMIDRVKEFFKEHYGSVKKKCNELNSKVRKFFAWPEWGKKSKIIGEINYQTWLVLWWYKKRLRDEDKGKKLNHLPDNDCT